ncbi:MAG: ATP-binding protein [Snowella sp.]|nr:ATP-binding protein [Snowella sp.]
MKEAEEALNRYTQEVEDLYNNAPCGYHSLDIEGKYVRVNDTELKLLGYSREEMIGQSVSTFFTEASRQAFRDNFKVFRSQGWVKNLEYEMVCKDGTILPVMISATVVKDEQGNSLYNRATLVDISDRKKAEEQLRLSAERISLANAELSRAARLKDEFLAGMSHELRTPLNAVLGMSEALLEEISGPLTPQQRKSVNLIERSGRHLLTLINDILDLSKIEAGKMELEIRPVNIQSLCKTSLSFVTEMAHNKQIRLTTQVDEGLENAKLDERRIRQVLINLLSNAVKFTPEGGQVELSVRCTPDRETLEFAVSDTGIGIAADQLDKLFQPFMQIDSSLSRRYSGTGLGLSLVRRIVELNGGSITLTSEVNQGSCFTVILPWRFDQSSSENLTSTTPKTNIHHALVVEDSPQAAEQISRYLSSLGVTTVVHPLGQGVIDITLETSPDLIVLDILLPDLPGWEVLIELKANPLTKNIPVLIISVVDDRPKGLALGAVDYLVKPITRLTLEKTLNRLRGIIEKEPEMALIIATHQSSISPLIVLVEDTESNIETIVSYLQAHGFRMAIARNGLEAIQLIRAC